MSWLGILIILTKSIKFHIFIKICFLDNYKLIKISLNYPKIMQIYKFIKYNKKTTLIFNLFFFSI